MAYIRFDRRRKTWEVRKKITHPQTKQKENLCRVLPRGCLREDAVAVARELDDLARRVKLGRVPTAESIDAVAARWYDHIASLSPRTQSLYTDHLTRFAASLPPAIDRVDQILPQHIRLWLAAGLKSGLTAASVNRRMTTLKSFCKWASETYGIANPAAAVRAYKESDPKTRFLTQAEFDSILAACRPETRDCLLFIANTGLRISEFVALTWRDIAADGKSITVFGKGRGGLGKKRGVPLNSLCGQILDRIRSRFPDQNTPDNVIFLSKSNPLRPGHPIRPRGFYNTCIDIAARCGLPKFGPHALRHWFATSMILAGVPIAQVSRILGHASIDLTMRQYAHILPAHLSGLTECLSGYQGAGTGYSQFIAK